MRWAVLLIALAGSVLGDQVKLANGDRLSGRVQKLENGNLAVATDMAGAVTIPWANVAAIVSTQPLYIVLKNGSTLSGTIVDSGHGMRIQTSNSALDVARDEVTNLRSYPEQLSWQVREERRKAPHFLDPWTGFLDLGANLTRGNADTATLSVGANGVRITPVSKLTVTFTSLYARNTTNSPASVTADLRRGGIRYERNLSARHFFFGSLDGETDALQLLDLRAVGGTGYGRHVIKNPKTTFDLFAGATANREIFATGLHRLTAEGLLSEESTHKLRPALSFRQKLTLFPNLNQGGQYRVALDAGSVTALLRWVSWQITLSDRYLSNPVPGTRRNDILLTTGFRFTLLPPKL